MLKMISDSMVMERKAVSSVASRFGSTRFQSSELPPPAQSLVARLFHWMFCANTYPILPSHVKRASVIRSTAGNWSSSLPHSCSLGHWILVFREFVSRPSVRFSIYNSQVCIYLCREDSISLCTARELSRALWMGNLPSFGFCSSCHSLFQMINSV